MYTHVHTHTHTHTVECHSAIRRNKSESVPVRQMKVELIIQSETQKAKNKYDILMYIYIWNPKNTDKPIYSQEKRNRHKEQTCGHSRGRREWDEWRE